ncbi:UDP-N-acetylenolpyruvoylglucosamine reductase (UDP-N-acetylmuramate dehydrogenase) [Lapidilactobacillus dextrinicus DSM 20335]|uniref:UDP-N-acetylenolpyruvoylglucosamine reductase n=1 Tax=Lapidilactobacillus dextrinicus DSM 20335 TaxID=1423738 RepID=A0A0R2BJ26_9LACO|nr:UDP-N-acetylmuramate dehydrogenase [Lapidilactobacillus dextrinicus]KRM79534.1 UDP-N-acetylenolpyruvoylglucosamine reductase (UDP-N-acetylmuramate dehydrogenase) [Lapidilactobacillus dextrinicus DSM 20335]QFG46634.1 UDP-N-acetylmuramate dehydrogenase [Lapidilactobacillus dextrinicus]
MSIFEDLNIPILEKTPMSHYTFTKTGGPADYLAFPENDQEISVLIKRAHEAGMPVTIVGNASNMIIRDGGIEGLVILLTRIEEIQHQEDQLIVSAGTPLMTVSEAAYRFGLTGLEFAAGIPGSVGGAVFMNAGAYGGEVSNVITEIKVLDELGDLHALAGDEIRFSYRHSIIQEAPLTVISATFALKPGEPEKIRKTMDAYNQARASKQPLDLPSCGSVFKRPTGYYTGPLIQKAGLQGKTVGGAQVSKKHAGFIVNVDHATATDYLNLIGLIIKTIKAKFGVTLEPEVRIIGRESEQDELPKA